MASTRIEPGRPCATLTAGDCSSGSTTRPSSGPSRSAARSSIRRARATMILRKELESLLANDGLSLLEESVLDVAARDLVSDVRHRGWDGRFVATRSSPSLAQEAWATSIARAIRSLGREVAIKVLPDEVSSDPERLQTSRTRGPHPRRAQSSEHRHAARPREARGSSLSRHGARSGGDAR